MRTGSTVECLDSPADSGLAKQSRAEKKCNTTLMKKRSIGVNELLR